MASLLERSRNVGLFSLILLFCLNSVVASAENEDPNIVFDEAFFKAMKYRHIGPFRGGRVTAVTGIPDDIFTYYMGATGGGVWKTTDAGQSWKNVSDDHFNVGSIGAIAVSESDPNVVYVGTGSACPRGNVSIGDGIYQSTDAGKTWTHVGLTNAGQVARVRIHPTNPDLVYAAVLGNVFGPNPERGIFRSQDGGTSWEKLLYIDERTGASDLAMSATNPRILFAGMWQVERKPWTLIDGGEKGGVYRSTDAGDTWERLEKGLPEGKLGRTGVAVSPARPDRVWVIQEGDEEEKGGLFRSEDGGDTFKKISREHKIRARAWYYNHVFADPIDENTVYVLNAGFHKSVDGGKNFERVKVPHGDNHDLWINPNNNQIWINSNDGGANVTFNSGDSWSTQLNQPTAEFYRVTVDNQFPYRVYGAQQDNSTISVPSQDPGGLTPQQHWFDAGGMESGHIAVDPRNPNIIFAGNYIGMITRLDRSRGHIREVTTYPQMHDGVAPRDIRYRFQWNAPIRFSPHDPNVLYHTSQYVHRSTDGGQSWEIISPDLTTNNDKYQDIPGGPIQHDHTGVELYTTIFAFEESPVEPGVLWAGSDDGLVHISRDNGKSWKNVTPPQMPEEGTVNMIDPSSYQGGRAYVAVYKYRENDFRPYIFRTDDYGASWESLANGKNGIPEDQFVRVVREDPVREGLLYVGTEFGMYVSFDDGKHWQSLQLNLPITPITDLAVHDNDLVVATQGRSFWILDDLTPLHQLSEQVASSDVFLFNPDVSYRTRMRRSRSSGSSPETRPQGTLIFYFLNTSPDSEVTLEILTPNDELIRSFSSKTEDEKEKLPIEEGMNRFVWDFKYPKPETVKGSIMSLSRIDGTPVVPGGFKVRLKAGESVLTQEFSVRKDPRWEATQADLEAQFELGTAIGSLLSESHSMIGKIRAVRDQASEIATRALDAGCDKKIDEASEALSEKLTEVEDQLIQRKSETDQDAINYPPRIDNQIAYLLGIVNSQDARPTQGCYARFEDLKEELTQIKTRLDAIFETDLTAFNRLLDEEGVGRIIVGNEKTPD